MKKTSTMSKIKLNSTSKIRADITALLNFIDGCYEKCGTCAKFEAGCVNATTHINGEKSLYSKDVHNVTLIFWIYIIVHDLMLLMGESAFNNASVKCIAILESIKNTNKKKETKTK